MSETNWKRPVIIVTYLVAVATSIATHNWSAALFAAGAAIANWQLHEREVSE